jgi:CRISPR-associated endonuclease/helicase Cas3
MEEFIAHLKNTESSDNWEFQSLKDHLEETAILAQAFSSKFGDKQWGRLLGLWHDIGKYSPTFQNYIRKNSGYDEGLTDSGKSDHTSAGAIWSVNQLELAGYSKVQAKMAAYSIAGHHAGLLNWSNEIGVTGNLQTRLSKKELFDSVKSILPNTLLEIIPTDPPCNGKIQSPEQLHLWIRMLFSCLVDADRLDTERFMNPEKYEARSGYSSIPKLHELFNNHMSDVRNNAAKTDLNETRNSIFQSCQSYGKMKNGIFSITVPTGGGKTLSSMAWALTHAIKNKKDRIIIAIPFTSIITQTADIFRKIFGSENVVEHHSDIEESDITLRGKLAAENWDAPIIITTNVQLFESLYSAKTSQCRKVHNIVNSIIILDEVQAIPSQFLKPIISMLKSLNQCFDTSILLSTATQPVLTGKIGSQEAVFKGFDSEEITEIAGNIQELSKDLERVELSLPEKETEWEEIAERLIHHRQVLCIVNTRKDCQKLYQLMPEGTIHLSRLMCSEHIRNTITEIKKRLIDDRPVKVISTQLIEAGVDIDFPVVFRAFIGLDSIAQSAGRCNREGRLASPGQVHVFYPPHQAPPGFMRKGCDAMKEVLTLNQTDILSPESFSQYFQCFYSKVQDFDKAAIDDSLVKDAQEMEFQFGTASKNFRLIDDDGSTAVFVWFGKGFNLIKKLKKIGPEKTLLRKLQRYSVSLRQKDFEQAKEMNLIEEENGFWIQASDLFYDKITGVKIDNEWGSEIYLV